MIIKKIKIDSKESFLQFFENKIFHLIPNENVLKKIMESKEIKHGGSEECTHTTPHSSNSYGTAKEMVCVFNLNIENLKKILTLKADDETVVDWIEGKMPKIYEYKYAIMFTNEINRKLIKMPPQGKELRYAYIPCIENWYSKKIPIEFFEEIIEVDLLY